MQLSQSYHTLWLRRVIDVQSSIIIYLLLFSWAAFSSLISRQIYLEIATIFCYVICICKAHYHPRGYPGTERVCALSLPMVGWLKEKPRLAKFKKSGGGSDVEMEIVEQRKNAHPPE